MPTDPRKRAPCLPLLAAGHHPPQHVVSFIGLALLWLAVEIRELTANHEFVMQYRCRRATNALQPIVFPQPPSPDAPATQPVTIIAATTLSPHASPSHRMRCLATPLFQLSNFRWRKPPHPHHQLLPTGQGFSGTKRNAQEAQFSTVGGFCLGHNLSTS